MTGRSQTMWSWKYKNLRPITLTFTLKSSIFVYTYKSLHTRNPICKIVQATHSPATLPCHPNFSTQSSSVPGQAHGPLWPSLATSDPALSPSSHLGLVPLSPGASQLPSQSNMGAPPHYRAWGERRNLSSAMLSFPKQVGHSECKQCVVNDWWWGRYWLSSLPSWARAFSRCLLASTPSPGAAPHHARSGNLLLSSHDCNTVRTN